ncbi:MAG TPA: sugar ABC transporter ATP-binding protein [Chthoniobacteraceae bacterium]|jgi:ribose transport system ATP-binding protein|nr:sugar ABC transporter ATP-binding protein [Chthoniobacteraceae bacterium]
MPAPLLELRGVTKRFPGVLALSEVSLEVYPGEIVALIGENGAGKSTLLKTLGGVHQPDEGSIQIDGKPVTIRDVNDAMAFGIGFIHQELNVLDNVDVAGNIYLGREPVMGGPLRLINRKKIHADAARYMKRLGITSVPTTARVGDLPIAYQQMVEIAKALSMDTRILLMDEPTSSLTLSETETLLKITQDLRAEGVSIVYISHRLSEVMQIADRVVALRDGKNAGGLSREQITHDNMVKLMVGRDIAFRTPAATKPGETVLEVKDLRTQRYPGQNVSFTLKRGEIVGFAGLVGAGRSEVAQTIFGVDRPAGGQIIMNGARLPAGSPAAAIEAGIYLIPEDRRKTGLVTSMTIRENITLPALGRYSSAGLLNFGKEVSESERLSRELRVKAHTVEQRVKNLSGGNQQKVVLAKWMALEPKLLIFDEPTRGIDVGAKAEIYDLMRKLAENGVAVMMISSDMEEVLGESQRVVVMHEGSISGFLDRPECSEEAVMRLAVGHHQAAAT